MVLDYSQLGEHQVALAVCGGVFAVAATGVFLYVQFSTAGRYPNLPPACAIYGNIIKHQANFQNIGCVFFYLGSDMLVLALLPQLMEPSHAKNFFKGVVCLCFFVAIGFGHVTPNICRMLHGHPVVQIRSFRGDCIFTDVTVPISEMWVKALAQISCLSMYILGLWGALVSSHSINLMYWAISIVAVQFYMFNADPQTSNRCYISSSALTEGILSHIRGYTWFVKTGEGDWIRVSRVHMLVRVFFHFLINGLGFLWIWLTVPLVVSSAASPLDYIMNLFAVTFLIQLDDINEEKTFLIRFDAVAGKGPFESKQESPREVGSDQQIPLMKVASSVLDTPRDQTEGGSTTTGMIQRISSLELENLNLKNRLAVLEAKIGSLI
eukprot:TRINITY_DN6482_c0_g1_i1.p1 TRINITY_DN6482_c0_g1~~TRINITY_DN6482_c0_g1_i1.p1  ORF type:complete len:414 (+),score=34.09 TRINITY_DN6482_c0_g1_i1:105-1244(+)